MKVQRVRIPEKDRITWLVIADDYLPVHPIQQYLTYLENVERSPNTIRAYAHHLKLFWEYLQEAGLEWSGIGLSELSEFVAWLRDPHSGAPSMQEQIAKRSESSINAILAAVCMLYDYQERIGAVKEIPLYRTRTLPHRRYKDFLYHINKSKPVQMQMLKLKEGENLPETLTYKQVEQLMSACHRLRDRLLVSLLYESGMRIGQALGLRHTDIHSWDNVVHINPRTDNANGARAKTYDSNVIHVPADLMALYSDYLVYEFEDAESDYVFVNLWDGQYARTLRFSCTSQALKLELKYAFWQKFTKGEWTSRNWPLDRYLKHLVSWLNHIAPTGRSLLEESLEKRELSLRSYLAERRILNEKPRTRRDRYQQIQTYASIDRRIILLRGLYRQLQEIYDEREEYEKDIWDLRKLPVSLNGTESHYRLNFTRLCPSWLKSAAKQFLRYRLSFSAPSTCTKMVFALLSFSAFFNSHYLDLHPAEIDRALIRHYLSTLAEKGLSEQTRIHYIATLREFLELCAHMGWLDVTAKRLIFDDDFPKMKRPQPRFIPESVMQQLNKHIEALPPQIMRMILILQECGMRVGELCTLSVNCLTQDAAGDWFLHYYQHKVKKAHSIPIAREVVAVIQEQQQAVREQWGDQETLLFPRSPGQPFKQDTLSKELNRLAYEKEIKDATGKVYYFQSHQFRHTVGTRMINNGVPQHIVQRYLGHESPGMTSRYAYLFDQTMKEEYSKFRGRVVDVTGRIIEPSGEVDSQDAQWLKKTVMAQSLPNGRCALPLVAGECPHANGCLTCVHFRTDASFLPQHREQLQETRRIIQIARSNGWKRQVEMNERVEANLLRMISTLEEPTYDA